VGTRYEGVDGLAARGEMHIRPGHYVGIAPLPGGVANVCVVTPCRAGFDDPAGVIARALAGDARLVDRFASARGVEPCSVLGPLAVDARAAGMPGLLLAGDAAGFIDPMTGDGLRFAIGGGWLAAQTAIEWLARPELRAWAQLARRRRRAFGWKRGFDRVLRRLVASPASLRVAAAGAAVAPFLARQLVTLAGDVVLARRLEAR
jgi:flavin-dependent dehydrogenase